jgi:CheY-like chemotaxis protein
MVQADPNILTLIIANLIKMAIKRTAEGQVQVHAEMLPAGEVPLGIPEESEHYAEIKEGGPWALMSIAYTINREGWEDVAQEDLSSQASSLKTQDGLDIIQTQIAEYGGHLRYEKGDECSNFHLALPLVATQVDESGIHSVRKIVESHLEDKAEPAKDLVLMYEDDAIREVLSQDLADAGYRVLPTKSGREVVEIARTEQPDLILLDMMAREPDALDIAMILKQDRRSLNIPVLFLTTMDDPQLGSVRLEAVNFLVRPTGTAALVSTVNAVLGAGISPYGRVMIVESEDATRETLVMMIQEHGYRVTEAAASEEALAIAEHIPPELILINAQMAKEHDYWLLRGLRQLEADFDIFVLADVLSEAEGQLAVSRGASGFSETGKLPDLLNEVRKKRNQTP